MTHWQLEGRCTDPAYSSGSRHSTGRYVSPSCMGHRAVRPEPDGGFLMVADIFLSTLFLLSLSTSINAFLVNTSPQLRGSHFSSFCGQKPHNRVFPDELKKARSSTVMAAGGPAAEESGILNHPLAELLAECKAFGLVRFISVNPTGSVLETAGYQLY